MHLLKWNFILIRVQNDNKDNEIRSITKDSEETDLGIIFQETLKLINI